MVECAGGLRQLRLMGADDVAKRSSSFVPKRSGETTNGGRSHGAVVVTGVALIVVALNLRIAIAAISPVLDAIQRDTGISSTEAGLLATVPVICFGVFALATPRLIRRFGMERALWLTMIVLTAGIFVRLLPSLAALFLGTAVIGAAIGVANVLLPAVIKRDFPGHIGLMMGLYSMSLFGGAALSAGLTVPLEHAAGIGWRTALAAWAFPALLAVMAWAPQVHSRGSGKTTTAPGQPPVRGLWSDRVAWMVTGFMGLQSLGYYATLTWLPTLLEAHHMAATQAGWMLSFSSFPGLAAALATPGLVRRLRQPETMVVLCVALTAIGYLGLIVAPISLVYLWMVALGLGQGIAISLALGYIVARAPDSHHTAHLSTMAQSVGYLIACIGPLALGAIHDLTSGWTVPMLALTFVLVPVLFTGLAACRERYVLTPEEPAMR
jgi:MFS transporter, CP family, cyanate transporter